MEKALRLWLFGTCIMGAACSGLEGDKAEPANILLLVVLFLEAHDAFTLLKHHVVPITYAAVSLHLADGEVVLVTEANLIDPVLAGLDADLADGPVLVEHNQLVALVDSRVPSEGRHNAV